MSRRTLLLQLAATLLSASPLTTWAQLRAFPEAEGHGAYAAGGRGGAVYHVTSLGDDANQAGTLRYGLEQFAPGQPLTVVFDVAGYITLNSKLGITRDNVTLAGQTAPGGGIGVRGDQVSVGADDVVIRHMRFRPGKSAGRVDSLSISSGHNVVLDHVSAAFSYDENVSANALERGGVANLTMQYSAVAFGLVDHSAGSLIQNAENLSFHHNLYAHNHTRNPKARVEGDGIDWLSNVVYDYNNAFIAGDSDTTDFFWTANFAGNTYITGPGDTGRPMITGGRSWNYGVHFGANAYDNDGDAIHDPFDYVGNGVDASGLVNVVNGSYSWSPVPYGTQSVYLEPTTHAAYLRTLSQFGATPWNRDEVDALLYDNVVNRTGTLIDREGDIDTSADAGEYSGDDVVSNGGFGTLAPGVPPVDTDRDGMPDAWEDANGLDRLRASDRNEPHVTGYTMLEIYLNELGFLHDTAVWSAPSGAWNDAGKWSGPVGTIYDNVEVRGTGSADGTVVIDAGGGPAAAFRLVVGGGGAPGGREQVLVDGGDLKVVDFVRLGKGGRNGRLQINGGFVQAESVLLANSPAGNGELHLSNGTLATTRIVTLDDAEGGGQFRWSGGSTLRALRDLYVNAPTLLGSGGGVLDTAGFNAEIAGSIEGDSGLTKRGDGELKISGPANYSGSTVVEQGALKLTSAASVPASSWVDLKRNTLLDVSELPAGYVIAAGQTVTGEGRIAGDVQANAGSVLRPEGEFEIADYAVGIQAEVMELSSDWARFDNLVHGAGNGGSYNGGDLLGGGVILVDQQSLASPSESSLIAATVELPHNGAWYLFARVAEPSLSVVPGDPATHAGGNNSLWVSGSSTTLAATTGNYEEVQTPDNAADAAKWVELSPSLSAKEGVWAALNDGIDYYLPAGEHALVIGGREVGTILDGLVLSTKNLTAAELDAALVGGSQFGSSTGMTIAGDFSLQPGAALVVELGETEKNMLLVEGKAQLAGELSVVLSEDYVPAPTDVFAILAAGDLEQQFSNAPHGAPIVDAGGRGSFLIDYDYQNDRVYLESFLPGDLDGDRDVDGVDYLLLQRRWNQAGLSPSWWQTYYGRVATNGAGQDARAIPEPSAAVLFVSCQVVLLRAIRTRPGPHH